MDCSLNCPLSTSLVSVFAIVCTDGLKTELKDGSMKHCGNRQKRLVKKIFDSEPEFWLLHITNVRGLIMRYMSPSRIGNIIGKNALSVDLSDFQLSKRSQISLNSESETACKNNFASITLWFRDNDVFLRTVSDTVVISQHGAAINKYRRQI